MTAYVFGTWSKAKVRGDYHVDVAGHLYSVPHRLVGDGVEMWATAHTMEGFRRGKRVAVHVRNGERGGKTTNPEHLPVAHRRHLEWTPERISAWAAKVGSSTLALTTAILAERPHPEQGYRSCLGILRLSRRYGDERLERACARALGAGARSYPHIESILKNGLDRLEPDRTHDREASKTEIGRDGGRLVRPTRRSVDRRAVVRRAICAAGRNRGFAQ
jgi:transposase